MKKCNAETSNGLLADGCSKDKFKVKGCLVADERRQGKVKGKGKFTTRFARGTEDTEEKREKTLRYSWF